MVTYTLAKEAVIQLRARREVGDLVGSVGPLQGGQKLFTYLRYNAELTRQGLDALGCNDIEPSPVKKWIRSTVSLICGEWADRSLRPGSWSATLTTSYRLKRVPM